MASLSRWNEIFLELGLKPDPEVHADLRHRYSQPSRAYHNLHHVLECLQLFEAHRTQARCPQEVELGIWFQGAIRELRRADNELRSALWARRTLKAAGADVARCDRVHDLVLATAPHAETQTDDEVLLLDIVDGIYGARPSRYDEYERQLRQEHRHLPDNLYRSTRRKHLRDLLAAPQIYRTAPFRDRYEAMARANIARTLRQGTGPLPPFALS